MPLSDAPMLTPTMLDSASGESMARSRPNLSKKPSVARKTPPSPTSSPSTITLGSRSISWYRPSRTASMKVGMLRLFCEKMFEDVFLPGLRRFLGLVRSPFGEVLHLGVDG